MATAERKLHDPNSPKDVGRNLRQVRKQQGLSRGAAARSAGLTRRELAQYERGKVQVPESDLWCLAGSCGVDVSELLPRREPLHVSPDLSTISTGDTIRHLRGPAEPDGVLREYLAMIYELRNLPPGTPVPLRQPDLAALADALGGTPDTIEHRLVELLGASPEEAARLRSMILPPLSLPSAPVRETPRIDPYAALGTPEVSPAVEQFFADPPATDLFPPSTPGAPPSPFAPSPPEPPPLNASATDAAPFGTPPADSTSYAAPPSTDLPGPVPPPPDPFASAAATPAAGPTPSDPFAGPVDPLASAASSVRDPFATQLDDPLAPPPLPPDPFALPPVPPTSVAAPADASSSAQPAEMTPLEPTTPASPFETPHGNGHRALVDDPFAPHWGPKNGDAPPVDGLGINVTDAIVVDDPMGPPASADPFAAGAPAPADPPIDLPAAASPPTSSVPPIVWSAELAPAPTAVEPDAVSRDVDAAPRFERAGAQWQIGGIFPAMAMADDGTLALRRADARWALTDLRASGDCIIEAAFDFRAGSGFGIVFRGAVDDGERITGYSFDIDPIAGGGGYLLRLWEDSRQHWRPLAQAPVTDAAQLYGRHVVRLALRADQLTVSVDGEPVLDLPALSRATVDLGRQPCRGDRVGVQAWSTTEVTVESFRVASL
ncbi:MAG TPA: helix-turn-helix domain-containing protein [Acidimicrobiia bacterium]|nr:helix-turn-helix domain-containing protein [Acidimicrobiia bacterium]